MSWFSFMGFNTISNNISVISWRSVVLVEDTGISKENHRQTLSDNVVSSTPRPPWTGFELTTLVVIGTDCTGSCKSNYHTITTAHVKWLRHDNVYDIYLFCLCKAHTLVFCSNDRGYFYLMSLLIELKFLKIILLDWWQ